MAKGVRDFKRRIRSVNSTRQITKAMKMVSAAKLRKAQEKAESSRPYTGKLQEILARLVAMSSSAKHPLLETHDPIKMVTYVVITGDRGLCGGFNTNIIRKANQTIMEDERPVEAGIVAVGRRGRDFYRKRGYNLQGDFINLGDNLDYTQAQEIGQFIAQLYEEGAADEVYLVFAHFVNAMRQIPTVQKILPVETPEDIMAEAEEFARFSPDYIYEPDAEQILVSLLPRYLMSQVYHAMQESKASEQGARMTAMGSATDNASELIDILTLEMNKARQAGITNEILEISSGAEALKKGGK
ncbi:MAG: F0F1 ATP synthase subunit gamma [Syntrophomonadaceae bacterium]|nr:F0F1 ATP synthase subunit gamma [Syntrophomonadaceae bacterium]